MIRTKRRRAAAGSKENCLNAQVMAEVSTVHIMALRHQTVSCGAVSSSARHCKRAVTRLRVFPATSQAVSLAAQKKGGLSQKIYGMIVV
jgi:hypothetical protein